MRTGREGIAKKDPKPAVKRGAICGSVAAEAVLAGDGSRRGLAGYEQRWKKEFYWQYRMGRASLQTLSMMKDAEIDRLVHGLSGKRPISDGSFAKKAAYAAGIVLLTRPRTVLDLAMNLMRG
jgi:flavin-dependent dehydrogenase